MTQIGHHQPFNVDVKKQPLDAALDPKLLSGAGYSRHLPRAVTQRSQAAKGSMGY